MRPLLVKILFGLGLIISAVIILFSLLLYLSHFSAPLLQKHRSDLEHWVTAITHKNIQFQSVRVGRIGINPELQLRGVSVQNINSQNTVHIDEMDIELDLLRSLWHRRFLPKLLIVSGAHFDLYSSKRFNKQQLMDYLRQLFSIQSGIYLRGLYIKYHSAINSTIVCHNVRFFVVKNGSGYKIGGAGNFVNNNQNKFRFIIKLPGKIDNLNDMSASGFVAVDDLSVRLIEQFGIKSDLLPKTGDLSLSAWFIKHSQQKVPRVHMLFRLTNINKPDQIHIGSLRGNAVIQYQNKSWQINGNYQDLSFNYAKLFRQPISLNNIATIVTVAKKFDGWHLRFSYITAKNVDASVMGNMKVIIPNDNSSPMVAFVGNITSKHVSNVKRYYPTKIMPKDFIVWLDNAIKDNQGADGVIILQGPIDDFPFPKHHGRFLLDGVVHNVEFSYAPNWPNLDDVNGSLRFDNDAMHIRAKAKLFDATLNNINVDVADMLNPVVKASGDVVSTNADLIKFLGSSPLKKNLFFDWHDIKPSGSAFMKLQFTIPVLDSKQPDTINGLLSEKDGAIFLPNSSLGLTDINGNILFTQNSYMAKNITANFLDAPIKINITTLGGDTDRVARITTRGSIAIAKLNKVFPATVWQYFQGKTDYQMILNLYLQQTTSPNSFAFMSDLRGITADLPLALNKTAAQLKPLTIEGSFASKLNLTLQYAHNLDAAFKLLQQSSGIKLDGGNISLHNKAVNGTITIPQQYPLKPLNIKLENLVLAKNKELISSNIKPTVIPPANLLIKRCDYDNHIYNNVEMVLRPDDYGTSINKFAIHNKLFQIDAKGWWHNINSATKTVFTGVFKTEDMGGFLNNWYNFNKLAGGKGDIAFKLTWPGAPYAVSLKIIEGELNSAFTDGTVIHLDKKTQNKIGVGQALNFLSLDALPQRFSKDFGGIAKKGFTFSSFTSNLKLKNGTAYIEKMFIDSVVARIKIRGQIDLVGQEYDLLAEVMPNMTGSLPVVATVVGGPIAGVAALAADEIFRHAVQPFIAYKYKILGPWNQPKVKKLTK